MSAAILNKDILIICDENGNVIAKLKPTMTGTGQTLDRKKFMKIQGTVIK